jgi:hypothetical protein
MVDGQECEILGEEDRSGNRIIHMTPKEHTVYRERTPWPQWVTVIFWGSMVACTYPLLAGWGTDTPFEQRLAATAAIVTVFLLLGYLLHGTTVLVKRRELLLHLGHAAVIRRRVAFGDIESLESVRYSPMREFGGWGVRGSGAKQAWTARGDEAVVLHLVNGRQLYVGSDHPHRLEERIRAAAGDQLGKNA